MVDLRTNPLVVISRLNREEQPVPSIWRARSVTQQKIPDNEELTSIRNFHCFSKYVGSASTNLYSFSNSAHIFPSHWTGGPVKSESIHCSFSNACSVLSPMLTGSYLLSVLGRTNKSPSLAFTALINLALCVRFHQPSFENSRGPVFFPRQYILECGFWFHCGSSAAFSSQSVVETDKMSEWSDVVQVENEGTGRSVDGAGGWDWRSPFRWIWDG